MSSACGDKPTLVGGIGEINFGKQFRQGNRVYDSNHTAMALVASPVGNAGGYSYLYAVVNEDDTVAVSAAVRGRYDENGKVEQQIETRFNEVANAITTVVKDSMVMEVGEDE